MEPAQHTMHKHSFSDFLPLITVFGAVVIATGVTILFYEELVLFDMARFFMGYFFLFFGGLKAIKWKEFVEAYKVYDILAMRSSIYAHAYPAIELMLASLFLSGAYLLFANIFTLIIIVIGAWGVYLKLRKKEEIPCACMGAVFKVPMTHATLFEDILMAVMAAGMLIFLVG